MSIASNRVPTPPKSLSLRGRALWRKLHSGYEFDPHEGEIVLEICRISDRIDALSTEIDASGVMSTGSKGQPVVNPAVPELRQQQAVLARLFSELNLPAAEGAVALERRTSAMASAAARKRWNRGKSA